MIHPDPSSFRDPSGLVFVENGVLMRAVFPVYDRHYDVLMSSGLYDLLVKEGLMVPHTELKNSVTVPGAHKILIPERISLITYPSEWIFSQLKLAALLTLRIQLAALERGMILKDASPYNVQFRGIRPVWIDTLSFEEYKEGMAWMAYRQFCEMFLAPLLIMAKKDLRLNSIKLFPSGMPLDLAIKLLPPSARFRGGTFLNLYLHSKMQKNYGRREPAEMVQRKKISKSSLSGHAGMLYRLIENICPKQQGVSGWDEYYSGEFTNKEYIVHKEKIVKGLLEEIRPESVYDLGANTGYFSKIAAETAMEVIAVEKDIHCLEALYSDIQSLEKRNILLLLCDLTEPAPPSGWASCERLPVWERKKASLVMALALLHHLAMGENVPYRRISSLLNCFGDRLIIEFIPPDDPNAAVLLQHKEILKDRTSKANFLNSFTEDWDVVSETVVQGSSRIIYYMKSKKNE